jgi:hypothetical protein
MLRIVSGGTTAEKNNGYVCSFLSPWYCKFKVAF